MSHYKMIQVGMCTNTISFLLSINLIQYTKTSTAYIINLKTSDFKRCNFAWSYDTKYNTPVFRPHIM